MRGLLPGDKKVVRFIIFKGVSEEIYKDIDSFFHENKVNIISRGRTEYKNNILTITVVYKKLVI